MKDLNNLTEAELIKKIADNNKEFEKLRAKLYDFRDTKESYHNIDKRLWKIIWEKYDDYRILAIDGKLYYHTKDDKYGTPIYKEILWNLSLSDNEYEIERTDEGDNEGNYEYSYYEVIELN